MNNTVQRLERLLKKTNLFPRGFSEELLPMLANGNAVDTLAVTAAMGEALAMQADSMSDYLAERGNLAEAGKLRSEAKLLHAEWDRENARKDLD